MHKDFDAWNEAKKSTNSREDVLLYREREVRWCRLGTNVGFEQDGSGSDFSRPVLIVRAFSREVCWIVPLTTSTKKGAYRIPLGIVAGKEASAILTQIRLIDTRRLDQKIATLEKDLFASIRKAVKELL